MKELTIFFLLSHQASLPLPYAPPSTVYFIYDTFSCNMNNLDGTWYLFLSFILKLYTRPHIPPRTYKEEEVLVELELICSTLLFFTYYYKRLLKLDYCLLL